MLFESQVIHSDGPRLPARWLLVGAVVLLGALGGAATAEAQVAPDTLRLTLLGARALALEANPDLVATRLDIFAARGALSQAHTYPFNPQLDLEGTADPPAGAARDYEAGIEQELEWAGQRGLRVRAAQSGLRAAEFTVADAARLTVAAISSAYLAALAADRQRLLARQILDLNQQLFDAARERFDVGDISGLELNLAQIELGRARTRLLAADRDAVNALLALRRGLGVAAGQAIALVDDDVTSLRVQHFAADSLIALALARRPDLAALAREADRLEAEARLARREAVPNLTLRAARVVENDEAARLNVGVALPFPLFNRNRGRGAQLDALAHQARLRRQALESSVRLEISQAIANYLAAAEATVVFERDVLAQARENQALLEEGFQAGKFGLAEVLLIRNQLVESELEYWASWLARGAALVELESATGTLVPSSPSLPTERD